MRRMVLEDPFARSAIWSRNLAVFALIVGLIGIALSRKGLDPQASLAIIGAALGLAALAVLSALLAMAVIWHTGFRGVSLALLGLVLAAMLFAYPTYVAVQARTAPALTDVTTDLAEPPTFLSTEKTKEARKGIVLPVKQSAANRALQERLYPDLQSLLIEADVDEVTQAIHTIIKRHKWTIVDEVAPVNYATGHVDVVVKSMVMGFPSDITFRIRELGARTQVDIRSVSRTGWQEQPGSNAARVEDIVSDIADAIGSS